MIILVCRRVDARLVGAMAHALERHTSQAREIKPAASMATSRQASCPCRTKNARREMLRSYINRLCHVCRENLAHVVSMTSCTMKKCKTQRWCPAERSIYPRISRGLAGVRSIGVMSRQR